MIEWKENIEERPRRREREKKYTKKKDVRNNKERIRNCMKE